MKTIFAKLNYIIFIIMGIFNESCGPQELPKYAVVDKLRIIAMKASSPEVSPGDPLPSVSALVLDPEGNGRTLSYEWVGCTEPLSTSDLRHDCIDAPDRVSLGTATSTTMGAITLSSSFLSGLPASKAYNGLNYIVALKVTAEDEVVQAFKRIVISDSAKTTKNSNPLVNSLNRNGTELSDGDSVGSGEETLIANIPSTSYENYSYYDAGGDLQTLQEDLLITWFSTEGNMKSARTFKGKLDNVWIAPEGKKRSTVTIAVVVHDGRGGIDWKTINLQ